MMLNPEDEYALYMQKPRTPLVKYKSVMVPVEREPQRPFKETFSVQRELDYLLRLYKDHEVGTQQEFEMEVRRWLCSQRPLF